MANILSPVDSTVRPTPQAGAQQLVVTYVPNHSFVSYGHGTNDSFVHSVSGRRLQRTTAVVMHHQSALQAPQAGAASPQAASALPNAKPETN